MSDSGRLPAFQFYPADWQGNSNLRRCTHEEKGIWVDVMCVLHDQADYGIVRWPLSELATATGTTVKKLQSLIAKGVLKGVEAGQVEPFVYVPRSGRKDGEPVTLVSEQPGPLYYSSRMVKDAYVRRVRGQTSRFQDGQNPSPKKSPKGGFGAVKGDGSSSSSSSSSTNTPQSPPRGAARAGEENGVAWLERLALIRSKVPNIDQTSPQANNMAPLRRLVEAEGVPWECVFDAVVQVGASLCTKSRPLRSFKHPAIAEMAHANFLTMKGEQNGDAKPRPNGRQLSGLAGAAMRIAARNGIDLEHEGSTHDRFAHMWDDIDDPPELEPSDGADHGSTPASK